MDYNYIITNFNGIDTLYRILGTINSRKSLEAYHNGQWSNELKLRQSFMNKCDTGWLDDDDATSYEEAINQLLKKIDRAKEMALEYHGSQLYGTDPYEYHLAHVIETLNENNILPNTEGNIDLHVAAWLHDIIEDTNIDPVIISKTFGPHVLKIVQSVTDGEGKSRSVKKADMMKRLIKNQNGMIVKLADRISNIQRSIDNKKEKKLAMYIMENDAFSLQIEEAIATKDGLRLLKTLNKLVEENR